MNQRLDNRVAIVTGAGRGIGRAIAEELVRNGAAVVVAARNVDELEETARLLRLRGGRCLAVPADVADPRQVGALVETTLKEFEQIDALVNNAGVLGPIGRLVQNDPQQWMRTLEINLAGPMIGMQKVLPHMIERRQGKIVNMSGGGATAPRANFSAYAASKAALVRLTETVAEEVRTFNIQVNAVAPGAINTRMLEQVLEAGEAAGAETEAARRQQEDGGASVEMAAQFIAFLLSESSGELSGKLLSAVHDHWRNWTNADLARIGRNSWLTLRRLDAHTLSPFVEELAPGCVC